jgi:MscS family membrane protein
VPPGWITWLFSLPEWVFTFYDGQTVWQWAGLVLMVLLVILTVVGVYRLSRLIKPSGPLSKMFLRILAPLIAILTTGLAGEFIDNQINITGEVLTFMQQFETLINYLMIAWVVWIFANGISAWIINSAEMKKKGLDASVVSVVFRISAALIIVMIISRGLNRLGVPTAAIITGLGVGGLAVSLALRSTIENLFGGLSLYADRPVRIGDLCRYGDKEGFVEEVGIRSVKIRGWDRTVTIIQNADFINMHITNISRLNYRLLEVIINLRSETTPEQLPSGHHQRCKTAPSSLILARFFKFEGSKLIPVGCSFVALIGLEHPFKTPNATRTLFTKILFRNGLKIR